MKKDYAIGIAWILVIVAMGIWTVTKLAPPKMSNEDRFSYTALQSEVGALLIICDRSTGEDYLVVPQTGIEPLHGASCNK